jgi:hypothetical protein
MDGFQGTWVRFNRHGGREVLYVADIEMPSPGPGEVVVEVRAAGINPGRRHRAGRCMMFRSLSVLRGGGPCRCGDRVGPGSPSSPSATRSASSRRSSHATHTAVPVDQPSASRPN